MNVVVCMDISSADLFVKMREHAHGHYSCSTDPSSNDVAIVVIKKPTKKIIKSRCVESLVH